MRASDTAPPSPSNACLPEYLPDYLTDSTSRRNVKVGRRMGYGAGLIPRLLVACGHDLVWLTVQNGRGPLYDHQFNAEARAYVLKVIGQAPAWCALQRGVEGGRHTNIILPADAVPARRRLPKGAHIQPVTDLVGAVRYLSGPPDARSNRHVKDYRTGMFHHPTDEMRLAAFMEYQEAKQQGRLPRMQWPHCLPRLKADKSLLAALADAAD